MSKLGEIEGYDREAFNTGIAKKTIAVVGDTSCPEHVRVEVDGVGVTFLSHSWQRGEERLIIVHRKLL